VDKNVISGTQTLVISGTGSSWFQEPKSALSAYAGNEIGAPNLSNIDSFGILLTNRALFHIVNKRTASVLGRAQNAPAQLQRPAGFLPGEQYGFQDFGDLERPPMASCAA
jgi:hypothetical protein